MFPLFWLFSPFFGEEFQFEVPRTFRHLSFYIYDKDSRAVNNRDKILGKVAIKKDELCQYHGKDHWFPIKPVDSDSEVQGKVNVDVRLQSVFTKPGSPPQQKLAVRIIECNDLAVINGSCDPYAVVNLHRLDQDASRPETSKRTKTRKKTACPHFDEVFHFDVMIHFLFHCSTCPYLYLFKQRLKIASIAVIKEPCNARTFII